MTLYIIILMPYMPYINDEIESHSQRYDDKMEEHSNILTKNLMKSDSRFHAD